MKKYNCERCNKLITKKDEYILLGYNGNLCSSCFEGLMNALEIARSETIKLYMQPERSKREDSVGKTICPNCGMEYGILGYLVTKLCGPHCYQTEMRCSEHSGN